MAGRARRHGRRPRRDELRVQRSALSTGTRVGKRGGNAVCVVLRGKIAKRSKQPRPCTRAPALPAALCRAPLCRPLNRTPPLHRGQIKQGVSTRYAAGENEPSVFVEHVYRQKNSIHPLISGFRPRHRAFFSKNWLWETSLDLGTKPSLKALPWALTPRGLHLLPGIPFKYAKVSFKRKPLRITSGTMHHLTCNHVGIIKNGYKILFSVI